ncbi:MAG TPA: bifunctional 5,10-methylenetetrahydrofolate dehydrogenase/5,10-methenyltetrahydrofolate cyclohydrolase [Candidatus Polarisedimenticolia bacterium]|nr:bifunctional 5,10-methylenetetrahydrofolate dehydrogenase/5,10-methenyltetrahydrofolate cyclohydrolase [Candidatus Polarisedimenticolia bacterium]
MTSAAPTGTARLLEGGPIAEDIHAANASRAASFAARQGHPPALAVVVCGRTAPSMVYLRRILAACARDGIDGRLVEVGGTEGEPGSDIEAQLVEAIRSLSADPTVAGIIVQQPLLPSVRLRSVIDAIDPAKDIDGIHPLNAGLLRMGYEGFVPATAHATIEILQRSGVEIAGRHAVVIGRSAVVGLPAAFMLVKADATVTVCHSKTRDLPGRVREGDIVVVAAGRPGLVTGDMLKPGAVVVDVGINMVDGHLVGDVEFESARLVASAITPVPGGVGPLTNALLLAHLMRAAERQEATERGGGYE